MVGHGGSSAGSYLADHTSHTPSHCALIVVTSTVRVNWRTNSVTSRIDSSWLACTCTSPCPLTVEYPPTDDQYWAFSPKIQGQIFSPWIILIPKWYMSTEHEGSEFEEFQTDRQTEFAVSYYGKNHSPFPSPHLPPAFHFFCPCYH